jgi:hypothetical protein
MKSDVTRAVWGDKMWATEGSAFDKMDPTGGVMGCSVIIHELLVFILVGITDIGK